MVLKLYIDTSALVRMAVGDREGIALKSKMLKAKKKGTEVVSSKLLQLEGNRSFINLSLEGKSYPEITNLLNEVDFIPITDKILQIAATIPSHIRSLDAIHLATCSEIPDVELMTCDQKMSSVARKMGIKLA